MTPQDTNSLCRSSFPPTTFECLRESSDLGNQFKKCLSHLLLIFFDVDFLLIHHQKALENYFILSLREEWKPCLSTGLVLEALNSSSGSKARAEQSLASVCSLSRTTFDNYHLFFWRLDNMEKTKEFTFLFIRGWTKNSKTQFIYGTTI